MSEYTLDMGTKQRVIEVKDAKEVRETQRSEMKWTTTPTTTTAGDSWDRGGEEAKRR